MKLNRSNRKGGGGKQYQLAGHRPRPAEDWLKQQAAAKRISLRHNYSSSRLLLRVNERAQRSTIVHEGKGKTGKQVMAPCPFKPPPPASSSCPPAPRRSCGWCGQSAPAFPPSPSGCVALRFRWARREDRGERARQPRVRHPRTCSDGPTWAGAASGRALRPVGGIGRP
jgi:hypothetical protein